MSDIDGARTATVIFDPGTVATIEDLDGTSTVADTPQRPAHRVYGGARRDATRCPPSCPPESQYTYAVELSADEAPPSTAAAVRFDRPVSFYVDNFVGMPIGTDVPTGFYDRARARWVPIDNGNVVEIVGVVGGQAELDIDGDGVADDPSSIGASAEELRELATKTGRRRAALARRAGTLHALGL